MKKLSKILLGASISAVLFASCANGALIANDTLDAPDITAKVIENGVIVLKWDVVKDAESYKVYTKSPGTNEWNLNKWISETYYTANYLKEDSEYEFKVVAVPDTNKKNLLSSEAEISVDTPEAWVDTAAFAASDIKLSLVPNTANYYELSFPINAGFKYQAKLVKATTADTTSAADLFTQYGTEYWSNTDYYYNGNSVSYSDWNTGKQAAQTAYTNAETAYTNAYNALVAELESFVDGSSFTEAEKNDIVTDINNDSYTMLEAFINSEGSNATDLEACYSTYKTALNAFALADAELNKYTFQTTSGSYESSEVSSIFGEYQNGNITGARNVVDFITEYDDDDNEVAPVITTFPLYTDGVEYRVVVKMEPINTDVATTKYILSSQTIKYDATGAEIKAPESLSGSMTSTTKGTITFYVDKYNGKEADASNYRIYQKLYIGTCDANGISTGSTTEITLLGTASKDSSYPTTSSEDVKYKFDITKQENTSTAYYNYTYYVVYTNADDDAVWTPVQFSYN